MGVQIYLDDFGTGYSSLSYLQRFPVNTLKIDRAFVNQMLHSPESDALSTTILTVAENLNLSVVARERAQMGLGLSGVLLRCSLTRAVAG